ncbi:hypothetical protein Vafri_11658 [Volvox africanus]|nr:hypothetical protein Vafri_11658 [Volvox africanus]
MTRYAYLPPSSFIFAVKVQRSNVPNGYTHHPAVHAGSETALWSRPTTAARLLAGHWSHRMRASPASHAAPSTDRAGCPPVVSPRQMWRGEQNTSDRQRLTDLAPAGHRATAAQGGYEGV